MPLLRILTNLQTNKIPKDFVDKMIPCISKALNKPENKCIVVISGDCHVSFGGESNTPGAVATIESIGNLGPDKNLEIVKEISEVVEKEIGINSDRFFLTFYDQAPYNVARFGLTISALES